MRPAATMALLLGLAALACGCAPKYNHLTQEEFGSSIFTALKRDDTVALKTLTPTSADMEAMLASADLPDHEKDAMRAEMQAMLTEFSTVAVGSFMVARRDAAQEGLDWKKAKLKSVTKEDCRTTDTEICDVVLHIESAGKTWEIFIDNAGKVASGWALGFDPIQYTGQVD